MGEEPVEERDERSDEGDKGDEEIEEVDAVGSTASACPACPAAPATVAAVAVERGAAALKRARFAGGVVARCWALRNASASPSCRLVVIARVSRERACCREER